MANRKAARRFQNGWFMPGRLRPPTEASQMLCESLSWYQMLPPVPLTSLHTHPHKPSPHPLLHSSQPPPGCPLHRSPPPQPIFAQQCTHQYCPQCAGFVTHRSSINPPLHPPNSPHLQLPQQLPPIRSDAHLDYSSPPVMDSHGLFVVTPSTPLLAAHPFSSQPASEACAYSIAKAALHVPQSSAQNDLHQLLAQHRVKLMAHWCWVSPCKLLGTCSRAHWIHESCPWP